jgi:hypothetical protein
MPEKKGDTVPAALDEAAEAIRNAETWAPKPVRIPDKRVGDVVPSGLWPDIPQSDLRETLDMDIIVDDVAFLMGDYGEFAVILYRPPDTGEQYTVACGGQVVVRKLKDVKKGHGFPILGRITKEGRYYDIA